MKRKFLTLATLLALTLTLAACGGNNDYDPLPDIDINDMITFTPEFAPQAPDPTPTPPPPSPEPAPPASQGHPSGRPSFGDTVVLAINSFSVPPEQHGDLFEITLSSDISFVTLDSYIPQNQFNRTLHEETYEWYNEQTVFIRIPITLTNIYFEGVDQAGRVFHMPTVTNPDGERPTSAAQGRVQTAFGDYDISSINYMAQGETVHTYLHLKYEGDGDYLFHFLVAAFTGSRLQFGITVEK
ncbi:MAG: hypothetical protein FWC69_01865 [Defluviitaleaceae bacterium]|nr:hypothetical protein [Defluviitaleaceae bacterium]